MINKLKDIKVQICLVAFGLLLISVDILILNLQYKKKIENIENNIKQVKLDYQFLKYNKEQLEEINGK